MTIESSVQKNEPAGAHTVVLEERKNLTVTGVLRVVSCDPDMAALETPHGTLTVGGENLCVGELSVAAGKVQISGSIEYLQYTQTREKPVSFFKRLVK